MSEQDKLIEKIMKFPHEARGLVDFFFTDEDKRFILSRTEEIFRKDEMNPGYREDAFHRGVISKAEDNGETYRLNDFYGMLGVVAVDQTEKYHTLPEQRRKELDRWYFQAYMDSLDSDLTHRPTPDRVLLLQEMLDFIDREERPLYLNYCDCKSLNGACGLPTHTCINFLPGLNSFVDRGLSQPLTKEEAKEVICNADRAGLVHTISDHGICNCCDDCCYLFRGQRERGSVGFWPESQHIISMDTDKCIGCGKCEKRCHFGVFVKQGTGRNAQIHMDRLKCVGCGLCENTCPVGALKTINRSPEQMQIAGRFGITEEQEREEQK